MQEVAANRRSCWYCSILTNSSRNSRKDNSSHSATHNFKFTYRFRVKACQDLFREFPPLAGITTLVVEPNPNRSTGTSFKRDRKLHQHHHQHQHQHQRRKRWSQLTSIRRRRRENQKTNHYSTPSAAPAANRKSTEGEDPCSSWVVRLSANAIPVFFSE
jgi:hypothetical protein